MEDLLKAWEKNYQRLEDARNRKTTRLQSTKMNARALQLKYCIKALREQLNLTDVVKSLPSKEVLNIKMNSEIERWKFDDYIQKETYKVGFKDCYSWIEKIITK